MAQIVIEVESCKQCPHMITGNYWSSDGWDRMEDWMCKACDCKIIANSVEWHEEREIKIPEWRPKLIKTKN